MYTINQGGLSMYAMQAIDVLLIPGVLSCHPESPKSQVIDLNLDLDRFPAVSNEKAPNNH